MNTKLLPAICLAITLSVVACSPWSSVTRTELEPATAARSSCRLAAARSFAVLYSRLSVQQVIAADPDVIVIDWMSGSNQCGEMDAAQVESLRSRPGDPRGDRIVLAHLDIGRTQPVRPVFSADAADGSCVPAVFIPTSVAAPEGSVPRVDSADWAAFLAGGVNSAVERIAGLGFDGIYVDGIDAGIASLLPDQTAAIKMSGLLRHVAGRGREISPGFLVVVVNPVGIEKGNELVGVVDGVAVHQAMFAGGYVKPAAELTGILASLNAFRAAGLPVLSVEFIDDGIQLSHYQTICNSMGYLCYPGVPAMNMLNRPFNAGNGGTCSR
ncbi:MAG TPA: hypothetical protein PKK50_00970 [Myxococcota bacterium]|nr:endo alpha-1,4 polygalactosaminidase [Myxococcota bacterium]HNZ02691.1 hypothetical protein [Myxococcota bacterium]HOD06718.1 hypothetical protein [Myxococcota bacterium]